MKYDSDPEKAARKLLEIANAVEAEQDGRTHIEKINAPLFRSVQRRPNTVLESAAGWCCTRAARM